MSNFEPIKLDKYEYGEVRFLDIPDHDSHSGERRITVDINTGDHGVFILSDWASKADRDDEDADAERVLIIWPEDIPAIIKALTAGYNYMCLDDADKIGA